MELPVDNDPLTKVMVVDDPPLIVEELCEFLESSGYECVRCHSSLEASERFNADSTIGIVLCDLEMPGMNGIEMVEAMKMTGGKTHLFEGIMLTGQAEKKDVIKALRAGIADYYQKPVDLEELLEGVQLQPCTRVRKPVSNWACSTSSSSSWPPPSTTFTRIWTASRTTPNPRAKRVTARNVMGRCRWHWPSCHLANWTWLAWSVPG